MENEKRLWNAELVETSKLAPFVKSLWGRTHDENGKLLANGVLWYDAALIHRIHPYYANENLPMFGEERDRVAVLMHRDILEARKGKDVAKMIGEGQLFGTIKGIQSSMDALESCLATIPVKDKQRYLNADKHKEVAKLDNNGERWKSGSAWELVQQRNSLSKEGLKQEASRSSVNFQFSERGTADRNPFPQQERVKETTKISFLSRMGNKIKGLFRSEETVQAQPVVQEPVPETKYTMIDAIVDQYHVDMEKFGQETQVALEERKQEILNQPWPRKQKQQVLAKEAQRQRRFNHFRQPRPVVDREGR